MSEALSLGLFYISFQAKQGPYRERNSGDRKVIKIVRDPVLVRTLSFLRNAAEVSLSTLFAWRLVCDSGFIRL